MTAKYEKRQRAHSEPLISPLSPPAAIVGRQRELTLVMNQYEAARQGQAHVVLLAGDPGIGKTRLLDEIARRTAQAGAIILRGGASEADAMPPYLPFVEALGRYIHATPLNLPRPPQPPPPQPLPTLLPALPPLPV